MKRVLLAGVAISMIASAAMAQQTARQFIAAAVAQGQAQDQSKAQAQTDQSGRRGGAFPGGAQNGRGQQPPPAPPAPPAPPPPPAPPAPQAQAAAPAPNAGRGGRGPGQGGQFAGRGPGQGGAQPQAQAPAAPQAQNPPRGFGPFNGRTPQPGERGYDPRNNQGPGRAPAPPANPGANAPQRGPQTPAGPAGRGGQPGPRPGGRVGQPAGRDGGRVGAPPSRTWDANRYGGRPVYSGGQYIRQRDEGRRWYAPDYFRPYYYAPRQFVVRNWLPPLGFYAFNWTYGDYLPLGWYDPQDYLDWAYYGLPFPPVGCEWVRVGQDAVLVDVWSGEVLSVEYNLFY